jgi:hypothetical protein
MVPVMRFYMFQAILRAVHYIIMCNAPLWISQVLRIKDLLHVRSVPRSS